MPFDEPTDAAAAAAGKQRMQSAEELRQQADACRRLALKSRTRAGKKSLDMLGDHLDEQARKLDPLSLKR